MLFYLEWENMVGFFLFYQGKLSIEVPLWAPASNNLTLRSSNIFQLKLSYDSMKYIFITFQYRVIECALYV